MPKIESVPEGLKPYQFHHVELDYTSKAESVYGTCPFCGAESKFNVIAKSGLFRCNRCNKGEDKGKLLKGGNPSVFIKYLWEMSEEATTPVEYEELAKARGLLYPETLIAWQICKSILTHDWLVPGYGADGSLRQLYRYMQVTGRMALLLTPTLNHQLHGVNLYSKKKDVVYLCEAWGDALAWWEMLTVTKRDDNGEHLPTVNRSQSLIAESNVLAIPSATVFHDSWISLFSGKDVRLMAQSDHPKMVCSKCRKTYSLVDSSHCPQPSCNKNDKGQLLEAIGYTAMKRIAALLAASPNPPASISILTWGEGGYDPTVKSGYDLRDHLNLAGTALASRITRFDDLVRRLVPFSIEELKSNQNGVLKSKGVKATGGLALLPCDNYRDLVNAWRKALKWTDGLDRALSAMLASVLSTNSVGDQLWLKIIGPASCGKTTLAEALATAREFVVIKDTIRGFTSGYIAPDGKPVDLLSELNKMTMITTDGDTLLQSPNLANILAEGRRLYDGSMSTHFKNGAGKSTEGHRMTWLLCGTASLRSIDSSELGERFLDCVIMEGIDDDLEDEILWRTANRAEKNLNVESDGKPESYQAAELTLAMQLTGGYVKYLRDNAQEILSQIVMDDVAKRKCTRLGKFVAYMRARPSKKQDETAERELAARLVSQHIRLAKCQAGVMNRPTVDDEAMRRTKTIAMDTARGQTLDIARCIQQAEDGLEVKAIAMYTHKPEDKTRTMLRFLRQIGVAEVFQPEIREGVLGRPKWRLTEKLSRLWNEVHS